MNMRAPFEHEPIERGFGPPTSQSIPELFRELVNEVTELFHQEVSLARVEFSENIGRARGGAAMFLFGLLTLFSGVLVLLAAAVYGLATELPLWMSALIVGGIVAVIGLLLLLSGRSMLSKGAIVPERTMRTVREDAQFAKEKMS